MFLYTEGIYDEMSPNLLILNQLMSGNIHLKVYNKTQNKVLNYTPYIINLSSLCHDPICFASIATFL